MRRLIAETDSGLVVGFGEYKHLFFQYHPQKFALDVEVLPQWQGKGVGGMLYDRLIADLAEDGARTVWPLVLSTQESAIGFLQGRGFVEKRRIIESRLDLGTFDGDCFARAAEALEGVLVVDISSEFRANPETGRKLKELEDSGAADVPGAIVEQPMSSHDYQIIILESPHMVWEGSFIAKEGERFVGESSLLASGVDGMIDQGFTVVRPTHRGRGIAQGVKLRTALYAKSKGFRYIRTHNDSENAVMLAINRKLGFKKEAEWMVFDKELLQ